MSRIYEAIQRADQERKLAAAAADDPIVDLPPAAELNEPPAAERELAFADIAQYPWRPSLASFPTLQDRGAGVEQFRSLRSRIFQARYEAPLKTILVCSGMPSEGKSFVTANLAANLARNSVTRILLIDADLRRPTLHELLGAPNIVGLADYLSGDAKAKDIMQSGNTGKPSHGTGIGDISNLTFIPSGKCGDNSSELVANDRMKELIATTSPHFDWILIDSPPVLAVTDAVELSHAADAVLLIARGGRTPFDVAQRTQAAFSKSRILGYVLNDVKDVSGGGYGYDNYYAAQETTDENR